MRRILARYLDTSPAALCFAYGPAGKPYLPSPPVPLSFNLAHAGCWGLLGICAQGEIGVDVEWLRRPVDIGQIAGWIFGCDLLTELAALPPEKKTRRFFQLWTAREARLKALGTGFTEAAHGENSGLATGNFLLEDDYPGAWAASVPPSRISYWHVPSPDSE